VGVPIDDLQVGQTHRAPIMHARSMTELNRRAGELAMIWMETIISNPVEELAEGLETQSI